MAFSIWLASLTDPLQLVPQGGHDLGHSLAHDLLRALQLSLQHLVQLCEYPARVLLQCSGKLLAYRLLRSAFHSFLHQLLELRRSAGGSQSLAGSDAKSAADHIILVTVQHLLGPGPVLFQQGWTGLGLP